MHFLSSLHRLLDSIAAKVQVLLKVGYSMNVPHEPQVLEQKVNSFPVVAAKSQGRKLMLLLLVINAGSGEYLKFIP